MKILLDECLPRKLKNKFSDHECLTAPEAGLGGKKNGELLAIAEEEHFEVFITMDKGIEYEQNLSNSHLAVIVLRAKSNRLSDLVPLVPDCLKALQSIKTGQLIRIGE